MHKIILLVTGAALVIFGVAYAINSFLAPELQQDYDLGEDDTVVNGLVTSVNDNSSHSGRTIVVETIGGENWLVIVPTPVENCLAADQVAPVFSLSVGDEVEVRGESGDNNQLTACNSLSHYVRIVSTAGEDPEAAAENKLRSAVLEQAAADHSEATFISIVALTEAEWSDGCLGLGGPAESCLAAITPGYSATLDVDGEMVVYRTDLAGNSIRLEED